jgi:hypothetical protein
MTDDEVVAVLRAGHRRLTAVELAELLGRLTGGKLSQGTLVTYFKRAFPDIPLRVLLDAGGWHRVSGGGLTNEDFDTVLRQWLGPETQPHDK